MKRACLRRYRALWVGREQWPGRAGAFSCGQEGWVYPLDHARGLFIFAPALAGGPSWYQVRCTYDDFLFCAGAELSRSR